MFFHLSSAVWLHSTWWWFFYFGFFSSHYDVEWRNRKQCKCKLFTQNCIVLPMENGQVFSPGQFQAFQPKPFHYSVILSYFLKCVNFFFSLMEAPFSYNEQWTLHLILHNSHHLHVFPFLLQHCNKKFWTPVYLWLSGFPCTSISVHYTVLGPCSWTYK